VEECERIASRLVELDREVPKAWQARQDAPTYAGYCAGTKAIFAALFGVDASTLKPRGSYPSPDLQNMMFQLGIDDSLVNSFMMLEKVAYQPPAPRQRTRAINPWQPVGRRGN
jgi:hypothetical protein